MQFTIEKAATSTVSKNSAVSIPNSLSAGVLRRDVEMEACCYADNFQKNVLMEIWNKQHPLIHTWLLLSSISICFLSALFFIAP